MFKIDNLRAYSKMLDKIEDEKEKRDQLNKWLKSNGFKQVGEGVNPQRYFDGNNWIIMDGKIEVVDNQLDIK